MRSSLHHNRAHRNTEDTDAIFIEFEHVENGVALQLLRHQTHALRLDAVSSQVQTPQCSMMADACF